MAKRFGGPHSPEAGRPGAADPRLPADPPMLHRLASRPKYVTIAASPFLLGAFLQPPLGMVTDLAAFGLVALAMWLTREGLAAEAAYDQRRTARRPALPRKLLGGLLAGAGLGMGAAAPGAILEGSLVGLAGLALHWLAFGPDPMRDKGTADADSFQQSRAARMIDEGEAHLGQIQQAIAGLGDRGLEVRVAAFAATVRELFDRVRDNPGDVAATRRYLGIYLQGARDATEKFAGLYARTRDAATRAAFEAFLDDLEKDFSARRDRLLDGDRSDLEIEIAVLRERLSREGLHPAAAPAEPRGLASHEAQPLDDLQSDRAPAARAPREDG